VRDLRRVRALAAAAVLTIVAGGCAISGPAGDKAGGVAGGTAVLSLATVSSQLQERPAVEYFIRQVEALSGGNLRIQVRYNWGSYAPNAEQQVVQAVSTDTVDLAVVGSRVFDTMGVRTFQALTAPMLIGSYTLENTVIRSDIARQMLASLAGLHVAGLGLLANGLRMPVAVARPLLGPASWQGITFGTYLSEGQEEAIRALGATPRVAFGPVRNHFLTSGQLQGFEFNLLPYQISGYWGQARYITANVALWPQVDVLMASPDRLATLTSQQRGWLQQAAGEAADRSATVTATAEAGVVPALCSHRVRFAQASQGDLTSLRQAFARVYPNLESDPQTRSFISRIQAIERVTPAGAGLTIPDSCMARIGSSP
jgi:TRAP-type C4-dicarboxylate transport system substrate-binding protein